MPARLDHFGVLQPNPLVLLGEVTSRPPHVIGALGLTRDAGNPQKILEFLESLLAGLHEEFLRRGHHNLS